MPDKFLSIDFETRSTVNLPQTGVYVYAEHPTTDIWCMSWAFEGEEPETWTPPEMPWSLAQLQATGAGLPQRILDHIAAGGEIRAWNAQFERVMWKHIMVPRYGAPEVPLAQWTDTAAEAAAMALPRSLGEAARVLGVEMQKDSKGHNLMMRMCRPRKVHDDGTLEWWDVPDRVAALIAYCEQDVRTEQAIVRTLRRLTPTERRVYLLDQKINDRGVFMDRPLVLAARKLANLGVTRANREVRALTGDDVSKVTNHGRLREWLNAQGIDTASVDKAAVRDMLDGDLPSAVRRVLELRSEAGLSSTAKMDKMLACASKDDRLRGLLLYHGASTGRWSGKSVQPHNFPRPVVEDIESYIDAVLAGDYDSLDLLAPVVVIVSSMLRSMLRAAPGNVLYVSDFSGIEARVLNWLAGQNDILAHFRVYDAGDKSRDPYIQNAMRLYRIPFVDVQKFPHRQTGKFQELGCGFGMGWKKAVTAAKDQYQLSITDEQAKDIVDNYRETHAEVVSFWAEAERACIEAVLNPGIKVRFGARRNLIAVKAGAYLYIILPNGRPLCYAAPRVVDAPTPWGEIKPQLEYSSVNGYTRKWGRERTYGGKIAENITQAVARDILAEAMLRLEDNGYAMILSVHDENVCETPEDFGGIEEYEALMQKLPQWAEGCPVSAESYRAVRYRK